MLTADQVDGDSTPGNNNSNNPTEDDEAAVDINGGGSGGGDCELNASVLNIICTDTGTPNNPADDNFFFDI